MRILLLADRRLQRDGVLRDLLDLAHALDGHIQLFGDLVRRRLAPQLLEEDARSAGEAVDRLHHMHGDADGAGLVRDRARDRLPDPPRRVRRKLEALLVIELLDRLHQAEVALLDQVEEEHPPADVALGDGDDQAQVCLGEALFRRLVPFLHPARQIDLFVPRKKRHAADVFEIHLDGIVQADVFEGLLKQLAVALVLVHDLDARLADRLIDIVDLIGAGVDLFQDVAQHVRRDAALLAIFADDLFENFIEALFGYAHAGSVVLRFLAFVIVSPQARSQVFQLHRQLQNAARQRAFAL